MNLSALEGLEERFSHQVSFAPSHNCFLSFTSIIPIGAGSNKRNWRNAFAPPTVSKTAFKKTPASTETLYPSGIKVYHQVSGAKVIREALSTAPACQELKSMRTPALLPDSIMARLRPSPRTGSTAVVLWKPPPASGSLLPDLVWPLYPKVSLTLFESFPFWKFTCSRLVLPCVIPNKGLLDVAGTEHGAIVR